MQRREFLAGAAAGVIATASVSGSRTQNAAESYEFKLKYAPHFGMFRHHAGEDLIDQLHFVADVGFRALEDNGMRRRTPDLQSRIASVMAQRGLEMGVFVATGDFQNVTFASSDAAVREKILDDIKDSVEVAKRVHARWCTVVPGCYDPGVAWDFQTANVVENLKRCAEICESSGLVMVLEPLNPYRDHPGLFLTKIPQAYQICKAVDSFSCKILDDLYHQQITEGNLIPNLDRAWDEIAYFQIGDNPGRKEPTTGEINYRNIFKHIHHRGFTGILGMEHGLSGQGLQGEKDLLKAYVESDSFEI